MECKVEKFQSPGKGNGLWATLTVPPGELLYVAEPFAYTVHKAERGLVCEHCLCTTDHLFQCARCRFVKYCSKRCQTEAWPDHKRECKCLKRDPSIEDMDPVRLVGKIIFKILGQTSPCPSEELYSVSELQSNYENLSEDLKKEFESCAERLQSYLKVEIQPPSQCLAGFNLPEYFAKAFTNRFTIYNGEMVNTGVGLYPSMALLNHSCEPNCAVIFHGKQLHLRAITKIHIGDELTITYIEPLLPTGDRHAQLTYKYCFDCDCRRCLTRDKDEYMLAGDKNASDRTEYMASKVLELLKQRKWVEMLALSRIQLNYNAGRVPDENIYQLTILDYAMEACIGLGMLEEALEYGCRSLQPYRLYTSRFSPSRVVPFVKVGTLQYKQGKYAEALKTLKEAFGILKICYGVDHLVTQQTINILQFCKKHQHVSL